jgi:hypothetical protein
MLQAWHDIDWLDQLAHVIAGVLLTILLMYLSDWSYGWIMGVILVGAMIREQIQHPGVCHAGCRTDLVFWALGCGLPIIAVYLIRLI